jgi:hypothetical protein
MDETTTPGTAKRTHTTFKSAEVLEDIAKVYDIQADKLQESLENARNKSAAYRSMAMIGRRVKSDVYPSSKPGCSVVTVLVAGLPKSGSGKTFLDATRDLERVLGGLGEAT